jgi:D-alanyl-D-alanine carboxypeptidase
MSSNDFIMVVSHWYNCDKPDICALQHKVKDHFALQHRFSIFNANTVSSEAIPVYPLVSLRHLTDSLIGWGGTLALVGLGLNMRGTMLGLRRFVTLLLVPALMLGGFAVPAEATPQFSAITIDARNGKILFADSIDGLRHPASLTKMMTLYVLFQDLKAGQVTLNTQLKVSARAASMAPSKLGLKPGSTISIEDAIKGLVTRSANDAASTVAENLGGTEAKFAARMTRVARSIGMNRSNFANASGLPNPLQITTARDMATLGLRLMRDFPQYYPYFRIQQFVYKGQIIRTHNALVGRFEGTDGIKTGYVAASGYNLVTSTKRGDKRLVGVVMGGRSTSSRNAFMMRMFEKMFAKATEGTMIAALPGTSAGTINPLTNLKTSSTNKAPAQDVGTDDMAAAAAAAAAGPIEASGDEDQDQGQDQTALVNTAASASKTKVLQASLVPAGPITDKILPFKVKSASDAPVNVAGILASSWKIQIGAFPDKSQAEANLTALRGASVPELAGKQSYTMVLQQGTKMVYRARFAGFDANTARQACATIKKRGGDCMEISPQS